MLRILVTSAGRRVQLVQAFKSALQGLGLEGSVLTADTGHTAPATYLSSGNFFLPRADSDRFPIALQNLCRLESIALVVPTIDTELPPLAQMRASLAAQGTQALVSDIAAVNLAADKRLLNRWLTRENLPATIQYSISELRAGLVPEFPVILKPAQGSMSMGVRRIDTDLELRVTLEALDTNEDWIVERFAFGEEYTVSTYVSESGECVAAIPRQRLEVRGGEVSKARTAHIPVLEEVAQHTVESLPGARGPLNVQMIHDPDSGRVEIIEVNARFGGGDPLAWEAGADAPKWVLQELLGQPVDSLLSWQHDLVMMRYDQAIYRSTDELHTLA